MEQRRNYSEELVGAIKKELDNAELGDELCVVVTGSFGRNEASPESDMDWFIFADKVFKDDEKQAYLDKVTEVVNNRVAKNAGSTGTFESIVTRNDMLENYGGDKETNQAFTRRMLYLLESKCLYNDSLYESLKREILEKYIKESVSDHNLNRFMLNDIIRYYRTICTDYEYKVNEDGKSWGVRKIKLRFSRKLLYFSGLIAVASTCSLSRKEKIERTLE
ncbi:nucleotidyltransferase domain-containing protein [Vibrio taketomensis]|uniref:nucleotidyltransferase domain-containing protein n=1 Tax=Vibrio taketomensis TaxID=2572923 RepID=UPI00138A0553|nr:nucleotidyltransferase domain-containing protein [Vibrio taketomensis]